MLDLIWLIPFLPFAGSLILIVFGRSLSRSIVSLIGVGSVGLAALMTLIIGINFISDGGNAINQIAWQWINTADLSVGFAFHLDALSLVFIFVITFVGFLIHVFSTEFMEDDEGFTRFFAYLNLFVCSMLILVLADNLLLMYLGWEGVGLCSYLLIGFWYKEEKNGYAARKAFIITRVGDTALAIGLFILFYLFNTLNIQDISSQAPNLLIPGSQMATIIALLLLGGAVGKSAQLPLQTWLPDAMAGPSPVSALIHAATMVTAGVYLIARMNSIFVLSSTAMFVVGLVGALTLLLAGFSALTQYDLKRVLAYSTISQIGYMFLALGVGAWSASIFHFMIHAFFKALLFLAAGVVILCLHHEHDMFKMGGLKNKLPLVYWTFLIGAASLAAIPLVTAGFYSKDQILWLTLAGENGNVFFFIIALLGAFITAIYTTRMVLLTFFGESKTHLSHHPRSRMSIPLVILGVLSLVGGFIELPHTFGHVTIFSDFLIPVLPDTLVRVGLDKIEWIIQLVAAAMTLSGVYLAYLIYGKSAVLTDPLQRAAPGLYQFWLNGSGFDALYNFLFVKPFVWMANINKHDIIDKFYEGIARVANVLHDVFVRTQNGVLRWYIAGIVVGAVLILTLGLVL